MQVQARSIKYLVFLFLVSLLGLTSCSKMRSIEFQQIYVGLNGPKIPELYFYEDQASLEKSWVRLALSDQHYNQLLSKIDFKRHVLLAFALGEIDAPIGEVRIDRLRKFVSRTSSPSMDVSVSLGIVDAKCSKRHTIAYPFVLATFDIPENFKHSGGYGYEVQTFPDKCKE